MSSYFEKATKLQQEFALYDRKERDVDAGWKPVFDQGWAASQLYAAIAVKLERPPDALLSRNRVNKLAEDFSAATSCTLDLASLFREDWLREINGEVQISVGISSNLDRIDKLKAFQKEFEFLTAIGGDEQEQKIAIGDFNDAVEHFQLENGYVLDQQVMIDLRWLTRSDTHVSLLNILRDKLYFTRISDILFLQALSKVLESAAKNPLIIPKKTLEELWLKHATCFPSTPTVEELIAVKNLVDISQTHYAWKTRTGNPSVFSGRIHQHAAAILWEQLLQDDSFLDDNARLSYWYDRVIRFDEWCSIGSLIAPASLSRFVDAAFNMVTDDKDLTNGNQEFARILLDTGNRFENFYAFFPIIESTLFPDSEDLFELYYDLTELDSKWNGELMHHLPCRKHISYLISQIVRFDMSKGFQRVIQLLEMGPSKPFILWQTCFNIFYWHPPTIPFLLEKSSTADLAFRLLLNTKRNDGVLAGNPTAYTHLVAASFRLLCEQLRFKPLDYRNENARIIFRWMLLATNEINKIVGPSESRRLSHKTLSAKIRITLHEIIEDSELLRYLLDDLLENIITYTPKNYFSYNTKNLPYTRLNLLEWLLRLNDKTERDQSQRNKRAGKIADHLVKTYLDAMAFGEDKREENIQVMPVWHNEKYQSDWIDWTYVVLYAEEHLLLDSMLRPTALYFNKTTNKYDPFNSFVTQKLRNHLDFLLVSHNAIYAQNRLLEHKGFEVKNTLTKLEAAITFYITQYSFDDHDRGRTDIFSRLLERSAWNPDQTELLPLVASTLNRFKADNRQQIIRELMRSDSIVRALQLIDYLSSEKDKSFLTNLLSSQDITEFFVSGYAYDREFVLRRLMESHALREKATEALKTWESSPPAPSYSAADQAIVSFRMKLLLAYHERNLDAIEKIPDPPLSTSPEYAQFSPAVEKKFYHALIFFQEHKGEESFVLLDELQKSAKEDRPTIALNRFAARLLCADQAADLKAKAIHYATALEEWQSFESKLGREVNIDYLTEYIWYNSLHAYHGLKQYPEFDALIQKLDKPLQLRQDFLKLQLESLVERRMLYQAERLLREAEDFHRLSDGELPPAIAVLQNLTENRETEAELRNSYLRIMDKPARQLIRIVAGNENDEQEPGFFLAGHMCGSAADMLKHINSISEISLEDKYTDLLILSLRGRLQPFGWNVAPDRGGGPASGAANAGLIDFSITAGGEVLAIAEPFQLINLDRTVIKAHLYKIFNYGPTRRLFYSLIYFKGSTDSFRRCWKDYQTYCESEMVYPTEFELIPSSWKDLTSVWANDSIKVARSLHGESTIVFHLFIHLEYLKPALPGRKTKSKKRMARNKDDQQAK
ncbi:MAG: hypothetical protein DI535_00695 [Citrobacter freundii]|nr:MAG: hypothetical protein DI535_00695 [Citrobacter freundii]